MKSVLPTRQDTSSPHELHIHPTTETDKQPYIDPVCGMKTAADPAKLVEHEGVNHYFCSQKCVEKFRANPQQYLQPQAVNAANNSAPKKQRTPAQCILKYAKRNRVIALNVA